MNKNFFKRASLALFALAFLLVPFANVSATNRYINITMHAGEHGHFEDGEHDDSDNKSRTEQYFFADKFDDYAQPVRDDAGYVFAG